VTVRLLDGGRELARATVIAPGGGAEAIAELRAVPVRPGLAVWTAVVDSTGGEATRSNNSRQVAVDVAPGRLGVLIVSAGLNWDIAFVRRALAGDSSLALRTVARGPGDWRWVEAPRRTGAPGAADVRGQAVVVLDGLSGVDVGPEFDAALAAFVRSGGGLLVLGGRPPGLLRYRAGRLGADLRFEAEGPVAAAGTPTPSPEARDLLAWDDDPARGERAWRSAAPLVDPAPVRAGAGDRVLLGAVGSEVPLMLARRVGRGQALLVNGSGTWRWALTGNDDLSAERGRRLWRRIVRWLAEPVQAEPLRVRPERWLAARGELVRLFASLQDAAFKPVAGAVVEGDVRDAAGRPVAASFVARGPGSYVATLDDLPPGRYRASVRATLRGREVGRSTTEFAVDRWSLEEVRVDPDSAGLAAMAAATGGGTTPAASAARWARGLEMRSLARTRTSSVRLWESPWVFAIVVAALALEWGWRRRRGLP
jgi:hypothetical protein